MAPQQETTSTSTEASCAEPRKPTRSERLAAHNMKCERVMHYLRHGKHIAGLSKNEQRVVRGQAKNYVLDETNNELYTSGTDEKSRKKVVLTMEEISEVLHYHHSNAMGGHSGVNATLDKISSYYFWNGMKEDVKEYIMSCHRCQTFNKIKTQAPELIPIKVNKALELVGIDLIGPLPTTEEGYKYVCTFTDYYTKFVDFYPLKTKCAEGIARCIKTFTCRWGAPVRLLSDQGREFVARVNDEVCKEFGIKRSVTSAYHPQTNGLDERTNQTLKQRLSKLVNDHQNNWNKFLDDVAYSIRTQKQATTKYTPFFLMFGRNPNAPQMMTVVEDSSSVPDQDEEQLEKEVGESIALAEATREQVLSNVEIAQEKQRKQYAKRKAKGVKTFDIKVGDAVFKKYMKNESRKGGKMEPTWRGPYRVIDIDNHQRVTISPWKGNAQPLKSKVPYDQLRPYLTSELHSTGLQDNMPALLSETSSPPSDMPAPPSDMPAPPSNLPAPPPDSPALTPSNLPAPPPDSPALPSNSPASPPDLPALPADLPAFPGDLPAPQADLPAPQATLPALPSNTHIPQSTTILYPNANGDCGKLVRSIIEGAWLTDEHIDHAQWLLAQRYSSVKGLHSVLAFEPECSKVNKGQKDFVQVLNVSGDHWVTVTNIGCAENGVKVYDSLYRQAPKSSRPKVVSNLVALLGTSSSSMVVEWPSIKRQKGYSDCGLFALAVATSLCDGDA